MRDVNGDGIPDYIVGTNATPGDPVSGTTWKVAFGTGTGFASPVTINPLPSSSVMELSVELVDCAGRLNDTSVAATTRGLYDIDGDRQPEVVVYNSRILDVYQHTRRDAGRLTKIDSGYGASTEIEYCSAKKDASTSHLLPHPETVVCAVTTTDASGNPLAEPTHYAYGGASQYFDAAYDRWVSSGYQRKATMQYAGPQQPATDGNATIADSYPPPALANFDPAADATARDLRTLQAGRVRDVTALSGDMGPDVWALLSTDVTSDARRTAAAHSGYSARPLPVGKTGNEYCVDMVYPHDYGKSLDYKNTHLDSQDQCAAHGFALQTSVTSWRGTPGTAPGTADTITSPQIVQTSASVDVFDDSGRVTSSTQHTDIAFSPNDLCIRTNTDYAVPPPNTNVHVLNAPATRTVLSCGHRPHILAKASFEYDGLAPTASYTVSNGFATSSTVTRYDMDSLTPLGGDIRLFDATYDAAGNPKTITRTRDDGATNTNTINSYDPFGLVPTSVTSVASGTRNLTASVTPDPVTLAITSSTDANGTVRGTSFDGFGRALLSTITLPGGPEGVLSSMSYTGFELDSAGPRTIVQKVFTDAVPVGTEGTAPGRIGTTTLDKLGRPTKTEAELGPDYQNKTVVVGEREYDTFGRVTFEADPRPSTDSFGSAYGTTRFFRTDGTLECSTRGIVNQVQRGGIRDDANEAFSTCFSRTFANNQEITTITAPDSWGDDGTGVSRETVLDAAGRARERRTKGHNDSTLEDVVFRYDDALGHMTSMTRYRDPDTQSNPVTTTWHYDSLGRMLKLEEPGVAPQSRIFNSWGAITQVQWCNDLSQAPCLTQDRSSITRFDGRGRVTHREEQAAGQTVPGTVNDYGYDVSGLGIGFPRNNVLGRPASATWPTGQVWFNYDDFGRVNGRAFIDTTVTPNPHHYEIHDFHDDGSEKTLHLMLQDTGKDDEKVDYAYDSAGRTKSVVYNFRGSSQSLFAASDGNPIYDVFGRITKAKYGLAQFDATYAASGRRLLTDVKVTSGDLAHSREIAFPVLNGVTPFDSMGRERQRLELFDGLGFNGTAPTALVRGYDELGRLSASQNLQIATNTTQADRAFTYDELGNILTQTDASAGHPGSVSLSYQAPDLDRICGVAYGAAATSSPPCNGAVVYDGVGNITRMPTNANSVPGTSGTRTFDYFPSGAVKTIADGGTNATFDYDAFGAVQQLTLNTLQADMRADKYFGAYIKQRVEGGSTVIARQIPAPGLTATKHGPTPAGDWTFAFTEPRGTRFVTKQNGAFVQGIDYQPFGEVKNPTGATPGSTDYTSEQWNGGDLLKALGVVNLGARAYDPVIGRFPSRDPIIGKNPYAFASNDPINRFDPTGLDDAPNTRADAEVTTADKLGDLDKNKNQNDGSIFDNLNFTGGQRDCTKNPCSSGPQVNVSTLGPEAVRDLSRQWQAAAIAGVAAAVANRSAAAALRAKIGDAVMADLWGAATDRWKAERAQNLAEYEAWKKKGFFDIVLDALSATGWAVWGGRTPTGTGGGSWGVAALQLAEVAVQLYFDYRRDRDADYSANSTGGGAFHQALVAASRVSGLILATTMTNPPRQWAPGPLPRGPSSTRGP